MNYPLYLAGILALGVAVQWVSWRLRLPSIVLLLLTGFLLGQFTDQQPGPHQQLFFAIVSLSVGIIIFEGAMNLDFREIAGVRGVVFRLVSIGLVVTWLLTALLAYYVAHFSVEMSFLLGALLSLSGPTVIIPLLNHVQPERRLGSLIKWEGIVNDPIGAVLAALVFEIILHRNTGSIASESLYKVGLTLLTAIILSGLSATLLLQMLRRYWIPDSLQNPVVLALVVFVFALSNQLNSESGLVTITLLGVILANQRTVPIRHIIEFKENLRVLLISTLFIVLASRLKFDAEAIATLGWRSLAFVALLILVVRPVAVFLSTVGSPLSRSERICLAWIHPRGIVAAAVSSLFALEFTNVLGADDPLAIEGNRFVLTTFLVIVVTVAVYGMTLGPLCRKLGLANQDPQGILFAGASPAVREIAAAIRKEGYAVMLVDTNVRNISAARMANLPVSLASIGSDFVRETIDLSGIGRLLAMTPNDEVNTLAVMSFAERFGRSDVYQLAIHESSKVPSTRAAAYRRGRILFSKPINFEQLEDRFEARMKVKTTVLSADFTYKDFMDRYTESALVLFHIDEKGKLVIATTDLEYTPRPGHKIIALVEVPETAAV
jgi:NhaP-type Na+/H+ or K+/H+ antiporter